MAAAASQTELEFAKQMAVRGMQEPPATAVPEMSATEQQELQNLKQIIVNWRELQGEVSNLNEQVREKRKRMKALEEMILRIMKKHNIGALDLKGSGGRLLYRRQTSKLGLTPKVLSGLLTEHLKSETAATDALKFINEHRAARVRESLLYEKEV